MYTNNIIKNTADCVKVLVETFGDLNWKRGTKFTVGDDTIRNFRNNRGEHVVVISSKFSPVKLIPNLNLDDFKDTIHHVREYAKRYYTHDYGTVYFNPRTLTLFVECGDGGFMYSEKRSLKEMVGHINNEGMDGEETIGGEQFVAFEDQPNLKGKINETIFAAEESPNEDEDFIPIAKIIDACDYDF